MSELRVASHELRVTNSQFLIPSPQLRLTEVAR